MPLDGDDGTLPTRRIDLEEVLVDVRDILGVESFDAYLFGSRRYRTGNVRSDIDIMLFIRAGITPEQVRRIRALEPYLDIFHGDGGLIQSAVNESRISAPTREALIAGLDAVPLYLDGTWQTAAGEHQIQVVLAERNPAATTEPGSAPPSGRADLLVVTALPEEFRAAIQALGPDVSRDGAVARGEVTDRFHGSWLIEVALVSSMGAVPAALVTQEALRRTEAPHVVLLGIAAGVPGKVELGDVVIPDQILYYEPQKLTEEATEGAPQWRSTDDRVRVAASVLPTLVGLKGKKSWVTVHTDVVIASGEKVVASKEFRDAIRAAHRKIAALDMESYGVARAAERRGSRVTIIKSICDFADSSKNDDFHEFASTASAAVFRYLVEEGAFRRPRPEKEGP